MARFLQRLRREDGQAMVEYAVIVALVSIVAIGVITAAWRPDHGGFQRVLDALTGA